MPSPLIEFYRLQKPDSEGRMLTEYWAWDLGTIEHHHDFIQWMFPLDEPSAFNPDAPLVSEDDRAAFGSEAVLKTSMRRSLAVFLNFLGLQMEADGRVAEGQNFAQRLYIWRSANHNWLRITRLLKSLRLLGFEEEAQQVWKCLRMLHEERGFVSEHSFGYWRDAAGLD